MPSTKRDAGNLVATVALRRINDWLAREASPDRATRVLAAIRSRARFLENFPHGGRPFGPRHRILRVFGTPYLIRYQTGDERVEVIRVHHERENWQTES